MSKTPLPFTSLNAVTAVTTGVVKDLEGAFQTHTLIVKQVGGVSPSWAVELLGSHDGINWAGGLGVDSTTGSTGYATQNTHLYRYVRADLIAVSGGPTITATIASA
jgi:hypothetical protein